MTFGEKIQALRKQAGLSQENLAEKLDITRQTVSKWELDQSTPELGYIAKLADLYNVSTDYLIRDDAQPLENKNISEVDYPNEGIIEKKAENSAAEISLGIILAVVGLIGILTFVILSLIDPWEVYTDVGTFKGLVGYLLGTETVVYFALAVALALCGIGILILLSLKNKSKMKAKQKN